MVLRRLRRGARALEDRPSRAPASRPRSTTSSGDPDLDAIVLATPVPTHGPLAERVLRAGKHCFVEKPLAYSVEDAERAVAAAREADRILMVGHLLVYHPGVEKLKTIADSGELGEIHYIYSHRLNLGQLRSDENALWSLGRTTSRSCCISPARTRTSSRPAARPTRARAWRTWCSRSCASRRGSRRICTCPGWTPTRRGPSPWSGRAGWRPSTTWRRAQGHDLRQGLRRGHPLLRRVHHPLRRHPQPADLQPRAAADRVRALRGVHPRGPHAAFGR